MSPLVLFAQSVKQFSHNVQDTCQPANDVDNGLNLHLTANAITVDFGDCSEFAERSESLIFLNARDQLWNRLEVSLLGNEDFIELLQTCSQLVGCEQLNDTCHSAAFKLEVSFRRARIEFAVLDNVLLAV